MQRTNPPTALVSDTNTAFDHAIATTIAVLRELWGRHRYRAGLRAILHFGPHLFADIGKFGCNGNSAYSTTNNNYRFG